MCFIVIHQGLLYLFCRTSVDRRAATRWVWPTLGRCVIPRGAAQSSRTTACRQLSQLHTSSVRLHVLLNGLKCCVTGNFYYTWASVNLQRPRSYCPTAGHVLSMPHDDSKTCERLFGDLGGHYLMAPLFVSLNKTAPWSPCSALYITEFFDNGHGRKYFRLTHRLLRQYHGFVKADSSLHTLIMVFLLKHASLKL